MMTPDLINAAFEFGGGLFILNHCRAIYRDEAVAGVSLVSVIFMTLWGLWNVFYYPHLDQMWSFYAGLLIVAANFLWVTMIIIYRRRSRQ